MPAFSSAFLVLERPTVFLDVPAPFSKGFTYDGSNRFGPIASSLDEMIRHVSAYVSDSKSWSDQHGEKATHVRNKVYDRELDGRACEKYMNRLEEILADSG